MQEEYAELLLSVEFSSGEKMCLVCPMELLLSPLGQRVCNEYDCPLLQAEHKVVIVPAGSILLSVFVVHKCSQSCVFSV